MCTKKYIKKRSLGEKKRSNITCLILYTHTVHLIFITITYQYLQLLNVILPRKLVKSSKPNASAIHLDLVTIFNVNKVKHKKEKHCVIRSVAFYGKAEYEHQTQE